MEGVATTERIDGEKLRELRRARYMSQEALSRRAGISAKTVSRAETEGQISMRLSTLAKIAEALGVGPHELSGQ
ncbi:MAG: hypothetical protein CYG60_18220 [Actinobacteria bacterium]|nr:MAG: hypothetical protein CYG60_18220 [Actinomycetota bacterium]